MRILQVTPDYYPEIGGVERHVQAISERLVALGHEVVVATMERKTPMPSDQLLNGVQIHRFRSVGIGVAYRFPVGLLSYVLRTRGSFDVVHVHNYQASMIPIVAAARPRRFIVTPHFNDQAHSRVARALHHPYAFVGHWALCRAHAVICVSIAERTRLRSRLGVSPDRIAVIPNGVDYLRFRPERKRSPKDSHLLLVVSRLEAYKQIDRAIDVLASLRPGFRLAIVGDGPLRRSLEEHARARQVTDRVEFLGAVSDAELADWYQRAHILINLSTAEAFGMTLLEAISADCQVVCSDIPVFQELSHLFPEWITSVAHKDTEALAGAVEAAADRTSIAQADLSHFCWDSIVERLVELYRRTIDVPGEHSRVFISPGA